MTTETPTEQDPVTRLRTPTTTLLRWLDGAIDDATRHNSETVTVTAHMLALVREALRDATTQPSQEPE